MSDRRFDYEVVASPLHDRKHLAELFAKVGARLGNIGGVGAAGSTSSTMPFVVVVGTGGSEQRVIERWEARQSCVPGEPALLVAHDADNSLPAALEALAAIRQVGGRGRIVMHRSGYITKPLRCMTSVRSWRCIAAVSVSLVIRRIGW